MTAILITTLLAAFAAINIFYSKIRTGITGTIVPKKYTFSLIAFFGGLIRILAAMCYSGHPTDMMCFDSWAEMIFQDGFSNFYTSDAFTDYPPGYMYVLYIIGFLKTIFMPSEAIFNIILKLPAIICDIACGYVVYCLCEKCGKHAIKNWCAALFIFNPAVILNSAIWGQVDSVFTLFVVIMLFLLHNKKTIPAYFIFALAIFIKPQALFYAPILIFGIIENVFLDNYTYKKFVTNFICGLLAIGMVFLLAMPFGIENVIAQYTDTIGSYSYATVNAYNLWAALGLNWAELNPLMSAIGYFFIILAVAASAIIFFKTRPENRYFYTSAFICFSVFMLTVKMHERYAFPAMLLMLLAVVISAKKEEFWLYLWISVVQFINSAHILFFYNQQSFFTTYFNVVTFIVSWVSVLILISMWIYSKRAYFGKIKKIQPCSTNILSKITSLDIKCIVIITIIYSAIALFNLGNTDAPQTYEVIEPNEPITIDFGNEIGMSQMAVFVGPVNISQEAMLNLHIKDESGNIVNSTGITEANVFAWKCIDLDSTGRYIEFESTDTLYLFEIAVYVGDSGRIYLPASYSKLTDESSYVPQIPTNSYLDNTYFDEIYYARTAYEFLHGLPVYEWTHPPLGKTFISLGIKAFGMTPFGWRIIGTLFGILMLPLIYIFTKKLTGKTWISVCSTILLAFDFMHFTQSRIATIDVYVTFFIMMMYLFMYRYYTMSFYYTPLKKTFLPLLFCGISMGLGIACKWTGVYAGAGLAMIFFITLFKRYCENSPVFMKKTSKTIAFCIFAFMVIPVAIYLLSYIPFLRANQEGFYGIIQNQIDMFTYHSDTVVSSTHPFSSPWYEWVLNIRPIWYYSGYDNIQPMNISAFGNPVVWYVGLIAFFWCVYDAVRYKNKNALFLVIAYLAQLLPWIPVTRTTFIYHYFPCVPFLVLMTAHMISRFYEGHKSAKKIFIIITVAAICMFIMFYPVISGYPADEYYVKTFLKWLPTWQLIQ